MKGLVTFHICLVICSVLNEIGDSYILFELLVAFPLFGFLTLVKPNKIHPSAAPHSTKKSHEAMGLNSPAGSGTLCDCSILTRKQLASNNGWAAHHLFVVALCPSANHGNAGSTTEACAEEAGFSKQTTVFLLSLVNYLLLSGITLYQITGLKDRKNADREDHICGINFNELIPYLH